MGENRSLELRHVRSFVVLSEELHFGRAAARLHLAQPALTKHLQQLEAGLGVQLVRRNNRSVSLTEAGRAFLVEAERALDQAERAFDVAQRAGHGEYGLLRVGFSASAPNGVFPHIVRSFRTRFPNVAVELHEVWSTEQVEAVLADQLDVGFAQPHALDSELLVAETVQEDPFVVAVAEEHPLAGEDSVALRALEDEPMLCFPRRRAPAYFDEIVAHCREAGFSPRIVQEVVEIDATLGLAAAGLGVALLPASSRSLRREGVRFVPLAERGLTSRTVVIRRKDDDSPALHAFLAVARERAASIPSRDRRARAALLDRIARRRLESAPQ